MILRRFMKHVTDQNWFAVGLDVLVVITGIFLGMQVTDWNKERLLQELAVDYHDNLLTDLKMDRDDLKGMKVFSDVLLGYADQVLTFASGEADALPNSTLIPALLFAQFSYSHSPVTQTRDELVANGHFRLIGDREIKRKVTEYYQYSFGVISTYHRSNDYRKIIRQTLPPQIEDQIRQQCANWSFEDGSRVPERFYNCQIEIKADFGNALRRDFASNKALKPAITLQISELKTSKVNAETLLSGLNKLIALLEKKKQGSEK